MARIVNRAFSEAFAENRDALLEVVRAKCRRRGSSLTKAAARLEAEYPDQAVRDRLKSQAKERATRSGSSSTPPGSTRPPINRVRAERLAWAMQDAVAAVQRQDHENPIGPHLKKGVREANALLYVVLAGLVLDPDAEEWLGEATTHARCPWTTAKLAGGKPTSSKVPRLTGYLNRGDLFLDWGHHALALMSLAAGRLGWVAMEQQLAPPSANENETPSMPVIAVDAMRDTTPALPDQLAAAREAFARFYDLLDAVSVPVDGGRRVNGALHAAKLSELTSALFAELEGLQRAIFRSNGELVSGPSAGAVVRVSDSPTGEGTAVVLPDVRVHRVSVGGNGVDALLMSALLDATRVTGFSTERWNALQEARPGGPHQRWAAGDVIPRADLDVLESASKQLTLYSKWLGGPANEPVSSDSTEPPDTVTNPGDQASRSSRPKGKKRGIREPTEKQRMPKNMTRPVTLTYAADWFQLSDWRAVLRGIERGTIKAKQITDQGWVFELMDLRESVRADAAPK